VLVLQAVSEITNVILFTALFLCQKIWKGDDFLSEIIRMLSEGKFWIAFFICLLAPYAMYIVAYVFRDRFPRRDAPIWQDQSKASTPGNFGLALLAAVGIYFYADISDWWKSPIWLEFSIIAGLLAFGFIRLFQHRYYSEEVLNCPSKLYHDFVMYLLFGLIAFYVCLPVYFLDNNSCNIAAESIGIDGLVFWFLCNVWDLAHGETLGAKQCKTVLEQKIPLDKVK
jgi:FtsH-binding integral membrane protein